MSTIQDPTLHTADQAGARSPTSRLRHLPWLLVGLGLFVYGLIAFNAGTRISPLRSDGSEALAQIESIREQADRGVPMADSPEAQAALPFWINLIARIESSRYAQGSDSVMDAEAHYYGMGDAKRHVLGTHMMVGTVLMVAGFFQFWPAFRRGYRRAHRAFGAAYLLAAVVSTGMSGWYLATTRIADVYSQFIFYTGLWLLIAISLTSLVLAMRALARRDFAAHLGWQALAFGCFLTAPIQRGLWIGMAPLSAGATFNEINIAINVALLPLSFFAGHLLFAANRASSPKRANVPADTASPAWLKPALVAATAASALLTAALLFGGLAATEISLRVATATAAAAHDTAMLGARGTLLWALLVATLAVTARALLTATPAASKAACAIGFATALALIESAAAIGMPSHAHSLAGAGYLANGLLMLACAAWAALRLRHGALAHVRELLVFVLLLAMGPGLMYAHLFLLDAIGIVPSPFDVQGHGYQLAAATGLVIPTLVGHGLAMRSAETRRHAIS